MVLQDAYAIAQSLLDSVIRPSHGTDVVICSCTEFSDAWVFGYNTRRFLEEGEFVASLVGNGPIMVPKSGAKAFFGSSAKPIDRQLDGF